MWSDAAIFIEVASAKTAHGSSCLKLLLHVPRHSLQPFETTQSTWSPRQQSRALSVAMLTAFDFAGIVGTIESSVNLTQRIVSILHDFKNFNWEGHTMADSFQSQTFALKYLHKTLKALSSASTGDLEARSELQRMLEEQGPRLALLQSRLDANVAWLEKWTGKEKGKGNFATRSAWALGRKQAMETLLRDLSQWVNHFHLAYISIKAAETLPKTVENEMALAHGRILDLFRNEDFQAAAPLDRSRLPWPKNGVKIIQETDAFALVELEGAREAIAELIPYAMNLTTECLEDLGKDLENTAQFLCQADPMQTRILTCIGYFHEVERGRFGLLFDIPKGFSLLKENGKASILTLHDIWGNQSPNHSLDQRARLARDICTAILYVHAVGWVHKDVCPQKILILDDIGVAVAEKTKSGYLPQAFLLGLHSARSDQSFSYCKGDEDWKALIYRHPTRQQKINNARYRMSFDIYSVGVILLELALWGLPHFRRFVDTPEVFEKMSPAMRGAAVMELVNGSTERNRLLGRGIHVELGRKYREVVEYCLSRSVLDSGDKSLEFVEQVWAKLSELSNAL